MSELDDTVTVTNGLVLDFFRFRFGKNPKETQFTRLISTLAPLGTNHQFSMTGLHPTTKKF